jgi:hypothetical protein
MIGDDERCVALAGLLPMRLLAERAGLTAGISAAMRRPDYHPDYDRGQVLVDLGLVQLAGGQAISDFQALAHLEKLIGPVPSTPTVWRSLDEADAVQVTRIHQATCRFRRLWWAILKSRPEGFPWLTVAGRELTGITVIDLDASVVKVASDQKENAKPTYKGGVGFVPNLATCDNVDDLLMIDPRPGNATSNDAADNIAVLTAAIAAIPGSYRRRVLVRLDGAGFSHKLLEHIATGGGVKGRSWEFSVGWSCTDREIDAIDATPKAVWQNATDQDGAPLDDTWVADITGLLDLSEWTEKIPGLRIIARDEPLHPKYTQRASDREKARGRRYQLIAVNARTGQVAWLDARHRSHVHVEDDVKQAKAIGLNRWPSRHWKVNVAWITVVAMAASLLAAFRHLGLPDGDLRKASIKSLRFRLSRSPPGSPMDNARPGCTCPPTGPGPPTSPQAGRPSRPCRSRSDPVPTVPTTRSAVPGPWNPAPPTRQSVPTPTHRTEPMIKILGPVNRRPPLPYP